MNTIGVLVGSVLIIFGLLYFFKYDKDWLNIALVLAMLSLGLFLVCMAIVNSTAPKPTHTISHYQAGPDAYLQKVHVDNAVDYTNYVNAGWNCVVYPSIGFGSDCYR